MNGDNLLSILSQNLRDPGFGNRKVLSDPFSPQISGNFLPELCGEVHPETAALQDLCCALALQNRALFEGENRAKIC